MVIAMYVGILLTVFLFLTYLSVMLAKYPSETSWLDRKIAAWYWDQKIQQHEMWKEIQTKWKSGT